MPPRTIDAPWPEQPGQALLPPPAAPPWGVTGGGAYDLLPAPPEQDRRFSMDASTDKQDPHGRW